jgi:hypothetical protein
MSLPSYKQLYDEQKIQTDHLLIGNGFSVAIWRDFNYQSLYEIEEKFMEEKDKMLFELFKTKNFEYVLESLIKAQNINQIFGIDSEVLKESYKRIKKHLIQSILKVHKDNFDTEIALKLSRNYTIRTFKQSIFTTNYDLISYWLYIEQLKVNPNVTDFFGRGDKDYVHFSRSKVDKNILKLYYLHGGLHLFVNKDNEIEKVTKKKHNYLIDAIVESINNNNFPLYVSEGNWQRKLEQIEANKYLRFCYDALSNLSGHLTIFGHSLNEKTDYHIIEAIKQSNIEVIAYGIYEIEQKESIKERINSYFSNKKIYYYNSRDFFNSVYEINNPLAFGSYSIKQI